MHLSYNVLVLHQLVRNSTQEYSSEKKKMMAMVIVRRLIKDENNNIYSKEIL